MHYGLGLTSGRWTSISAFLITDLASAETKNITTLLLLLAYRVIRTPYAAICIPYSANTGNTGPEEGRWKKKCLLARRHEGRPYLRLTCLTCCPPLSLNQIPSDRDRQCTATYLVLLTLVDTPYGVIGTGATDHQRKRPFHPPLLLPLPPTASSIGSTIPYTPPRVGSGSD